MMKTKICCISAVLAFAYCESVSAGALKNAFTKKQPAATEEKAERPQIAESGTASTAASESNDAVVKDEKKEEKKEDDSSASKSSDSEAGDSKAEETKSGDTDKQVTPPAEKKKIVGNPVIFRIGSKEIHRDEILAEMKTLPPQLIQGTSPDKLFDMLKQQKLIAYLVVEQAKRAGMDRTKEYMEQLDKLKERLLFETYLVKEVGPKTENEAALKAKYDKYVVEFKGGKEAKLGFITTTTEKAAKEVIDSLSKGTDFNKLAKEKSTSPVSPNERYIPLAMLPKEVSDQLKNVKKGDYTKTPIKMGDEKSGETYFVFKIFDVRDMKAGSYEEMKGALAQVLLKEEMEKLIDKLEKQFNVERFNEDGTPEQKK